MSVILPVICMFMSETDSQLFVKQNVSLHEYTVQQFVWNAGIINVPKPVSYDEKTKILKMQKIPQMSVADWFGEKAVDVPDDVFDKIRGSIRDLLALGVEYVDITGYNFIWFEKKIWVIDFEHARFIGGRKEGAVGNSFLHRFLTSPEKLWNPEFL